VLIRELIFVRSSAFLKMSGRLKYTFKAEKEIELHVEKDTVVKLLEKVQDGKWYKVENEGKIGLVQGNYMEIIEEISEKPKEETPAEEAEAQVVAETSVEAKEEAASQSGEAPLVNVQGKQKAVMKYKFEAQKSEQLSVDKGVEVVILRKVNAGWNEVYVDGKSGLVQANYMEALAPQESEKVIEVENPNSGSATIEIEAKVESKSDSAPASNDKAKATMKFKFEAQKEGELTIEKGEEVIIVKKVNDFWYEVSHGGKTGLVQANYMDVNIDNSSPEEKQPENESTAIKIHEGQPVLSRKLTENFHDDFSFQTVDQKLIDKWLEKTDKLYEKKHSPSVHVITPMSWDEWANVVPYVQIIGAWASFVRLSSTFSTFSRDFNWFSIISFEIWPSIEVFFKVTEGNPYSDWASGLEPLICLIPLLIPPLLFLRHFLKWWKRHSACLKWCRNQTKSKYEILEEELSDEETDLQGHTEEEWERKKQQRREQRAADDYNRQASMKCCCCISWRYTLLLHHTLYIPAVMASFHAIDIVCNRFREYCAYFSLVIFVLCGIPLILNPILLGCMTQQYSPKVDANDPVFGERGHLKDHSDVKYYDELHHSTNHLNSPFYFLYRPFARKHKLGRTYYLLARAVIVWSLYESNYNGDYGIFFLVTSVYLLLHVMFKGIYNAPISNRVNMLTAVTIWLFACYTLIVTESKEESSIAKIKDNVWLFVLGMWYGFWGICFFLNFRLANLYAYFRTKLSFEDTERETLTSDMNIIKQWDPDIEIKHRLWQPFWNAMMKKNVVGKEVAVRWLEIKKLVKAHGFTKAINHFDQELAQPEIIDARNYIMSTCEGVDCWYDPTEMNEKKKKKKKAKGIKSFFGKLEVVPFPFTCYMEYDNGEFLEIFDGPSIIELAEQNKTSLVQVRKETRLTLRAMASKKDDVVHFPFEEERFEPIEVRDGIIRDVKMKLKYEDCKVIITAVDGSSDIVNKAGFTVKAVYNDGFGRCMYKDRDYEVHDRRTVVRLEEMGIDPDFQPSEEDDIECIVTSGEMKESHLPTLEYDVKTSIYEYRNERYKKRVDEAKMLPVVFWSEVFNNPGASKDSVKEWFLSVKEQNAELSSVLEKEDEGINYIFSRMEEIQGHPYAELWFVFWHDVWVQNKHLRAFRGMNPCSKSAQSWLNPRYASSLCYHVKEREDLEALLESKGVLVKKKDSNALFNPRLLDLFYFKLRKLKEWSELQVTTKIRKMKRKIVHMDTLKEKKAHEQLKPMLQRAGLRNHSVNGMEFSRHMLEIVLITAYANIWLMLMGLSCFVRPWACVVSEENSRILLIVLPPILTLVIGILGKVLKQKYPNGLPNLCPRNKFKSAKVNPNKGVSHLRGTSPRDPIRWWVEDEGKQEHDINFNEHESVLNAALMTIRKGKNCEVEYESEPQSKEDWMAYANKHYALAEKWLLLLPLKKTYAQLCFLGDRKASNAALAIASDPLSYDIAVTEFKKLAELWLRLHSDDILPETEQENSDKNAALAYQKMLLCTLTKGDVQGASEMIDSTKAYFPEIETTEPLKRFRQVLTEFHSGNRTTFKNLTIKWENEWGLTQWYVKLFGMVQKQCDKYVDRLQEISKPDMGAEMDGCRANIKILLVGAKGCGKTNFLVRYLYKTFVSNPAVVLASKKEFARNAEVDGDLFKVILEEVSSVEDFKLKRESALGYLYLYDDTEGTTSADHKAWLQAFDWGFGKATIVGSKLDVSGDPTAEPPAGIKEWLAKPDNSAKCFRASAKSGVNAEECMNDVVKNCAQKILHLHSEYSY
jgi:hypothetical protein